MKTVALNTPFNGYRSGSLTGNVSNFKYEIILPNGLNIWLYDDEFTVD